jgi:methylthioribose-1-phosphate isomerase
MKVGGRDYRAVWWSEEGVRFIDQRRLPHRFEVGCAGSVEEVARAIEDMAVRGAPAIGVLAAYGLALAARQSQDLELAFEALAADPLCSHLTVPEIKEMGRKLLRANRRLLPQFRL